jgi:hypothetical protein
VNGAVGGRAGRWKRRGCHPHRHPVTVRRPGGCSSSVGYFSPIGGERGVSLPTAAFRSPDDGATGAAAGTPADELVPHAARVIIIKSTAGHAERRREQRPGGAPPRGRLPWAGPKHLQNTPLFGSRPIIAIRLFSNSPLILIWIGILPLIFTNRPLNWIAIGLFSFNPSLFSDTPGRGPPPPPPFSPESRSPASATNPQLDP